MIEIRSGRNHKSTREGLDMRSFLSLILVVLSLVIAQNSWAYNGVKSFSTGANCTISYNSTGEIFPLPTAQSTYVFKPKGTIYVYGWNYTKTNVYIECPLPNDYTSDYQNASWQWNVADNISSVQLYYNTYSTYVYNSYAEICQSGPSPTSVSCSSRKYLYGGNTSITFVKNVDYSFTRSEAGVYLRIAIEENNVSNSYDFHFGSYIVRKTL